MSMEDKFRYFKNDFNSSWVYEEENLRNMGVIFKSGWCHGFRVIPRKGTNPLIEMLCEDDGQLFSTGTKFDLFWARSIVAALDETIKYCEDNRLLKFENQAFQVKQVIRELRR